MGFLQGTSGNPRTCSNGAGTVSNEKLIIGGRGETDAHNPGSIDISDVLVFNRILNTDEINFITSTLSEPKPCPALKCTMHCDTGYVIDANVVKHANVCQLVDSYQDDSCLKATPCNLGRP